MKYVAIFGDTQGNRFEYDVAPDAQGRCFIDGNARFPLPYQVPDNGAEFLGYEMRDVPTGLRSCDAAELIYKMDRTLRRPIRPNIPTVARPAEPIRALTIREQAYALQEQPLDVVPVGNESSSQAYRRAAGERADQVRRMLDKEQQQINADSWQNVPPGQQALNNHAQLARNLWAEKQAQQFARQNGGHVLGSDGRAVKS